MHFQQQKMIRILLRMWQRSKDRNKRTAVPESKEISQSNTTTIRLTDMNVDCLEQIFLYLSLTDLLNIADTSKQLKPAAELAFVRLLKRGILIFYGAICTIRVNKTKQFAVRNPYRLLRCFGHLIWNLEYQKYPQHNELKYINQYCSESLVNIRICSLRSIRRYMSKPFSKVETVIFSYKWDSNFNRLPKLFPNVRTLTINAYFENMCIAVNFSHLKQVNVKYYSIFKFYAKILRANPQIRYLYINPLNHDVKLLRNANQFLQFLEHLHLIYVETMYKYFEEKFVDFTHVKVLQIDYYGEFKKPIPLSFSCLEEFSFRLPSSHTPICLNAGVDVLLEFLKKHPLLTKFTLSSENRYTLTTNRLEEIIEEVASMEEINIYVDLSINDVLKFVKKCKSLKRLGFISANSSICVHLNAKLGVKWQVLAKKSDVSRILGMRKEDFGITIVRRYT